MGSPKVDVENGGVVAGEETSVPEVMAQDGKPAAQEDPERMTLSGMKLQVLTFALCLSLFLALLDSTIVSTALVRITNSLGGFDQSSWIVNGYLLTYTGFLIITAKLSDIFGRRTIVASSLAIFTVASIACAVAKTLTQLIVFRAFQGIGGGGMYTMTFIILPEMCTPDQYTLYSTIVSGVATMSSLLGPIFGGLISEKTSWRWIFWLNVPTGVLCLILLHLAIPAHFPYKNASSAPKISRQALKKIDVLGAVLMLAATTLFLTALEESGTGTPWSKPVVFAPLITGIACYIAFCTWSKYQASRDMVQEPLIPWHVLTDRFCLGLFAQDFWMATILFSLTVTLPQRFQIVDKSSALSAGYRLLPVTLLDPIGSGIAAYLLTTLHIPAFWILLTGITMQTLGMGLLIMQPHDILSYPASRYGFEAIVGIGIGWTSATAILSVVLFFKHRDLAVGMGGLAQFQSLGGVIGVAISVNILNRYTADKFHGVLSTEEVDAIKASAEAVSTFPESVQTVVREAYASGFRWQAVTMTAFGGMGIIMLALMIEKKFRKLEKGSKGFGDTSNSEDAEPKANEST